MNISKAITTILVGSLLGTAHSASAGPVPVQIEQLAFQGQVLPGPSGVVDFVFGSFTGLNGTPLMGQTLSVDLTFPDSEFVRVFTATLKPNEPPFAVDVSLAINNAPPPLTFSGTGSLLDNNGTAVSVPKTLSAFPETNGAGQVSGIDFSFSPQFSKAPPIDFYRIHLDLSLPVSAGFQFTGGEIGLFGGVFGVGPGAIPADLVPDAGGTLILLALSLATLFVLGRSTFRITV